MSGPRAGEFFAPLPLGAVALMVGNDRWLKPAFHSALTGKLSDIAICFFFPLFLSELLGLFFGMQPRARLFAGAVAAAILFAALEVVAPFAGWTVEALTVIGPHVGAGRTFQMTSDWTDLLCLTFVPLAVVYGRWRLARRSAVLRTPLRA